MGRIAYHAPMRAFSTASPSIRALGAVVLVSILASTACGAPPAGHESAPVVFDPVGTWRAVLDSPGGELPFGLRIEGAPGAWRAVVLNGEEEAPISGVVVEGDQVELHFVWYDSEVVATADPNGDRLSGRWRRTSPGGGDTVMPFSASRGEAPRFSPPASASAPVTSAKAIASRWAAEFTDEDGTEPARAELHQQGWDLEGTFLTPTGDYRFLAGDFRDGRLRLSTFDGAHAFLFVAERGEDGNFVGDFWSRDSYHATWNARPLGDGETVLPDAWALARNTSEERRFRFAFDDLEGQLVDQDDPRFVGKVVLVNVFGSWCPNCNDEAPLLAAWHERYRDRGFEIVGLAYEFTGDVARDRRQVARFAERYGIHYPLLLAGVSDKAQAAETLPDLDRVVAYPTTVFIGRDGTVRRVHSGFAGPGTGAHHDILVTEFENTIEGLLDETHDG